MRPWALLPLLVTAALYRASPASYRHHGASHHSSLTSWTVALEQQDPAALLRTLDSLSSPSSPLYGQWLPAQAAVAHLAPSEAVRSRLHANHTAAGATCVHGPTSLHCTAPVRVVNALYATRLHAYQDPGSSSGLLHRVPPGTPLLLHEGMAFVTRLQDFPPPRVARRPATVQAQRPRQQPRSLSAGTDCDCVSGTAGASCACDWYVAPETLQRCCHWPGQPRQQRGGSGLWQP